MPLAKVPYAREGIMLVIVGLIFVTSGIDAAISFLNHEVPGEVLGTTATLLTLVLGYFVRQGRTSA